MDIYTAVRNGIVEEVQEALDSGIDVNDRDSIYGQTPLSWAAEKGNTEVVKLLLEKDSIDLNSKDNDGWTPLSWAAEQGNTEVVKLLLEKDSIDLNSKDNDGWTPLSWAAEQGNTEVVKLLLKKDSIDLNSKDNDGRTPLSWAAERGYKEVVKLLLEEDSIDLNSKNNNGRTPLSWAVEKGNKEVVELLLEEDSIDLNSKDNNSRTPLLWAVERGWGNTEVVKLLLRKDSIDLNSKDNDGRTPLSWAAERGYKEVGELLLKDGRIKLHTLIMEREVSLVRWLLQKTKCDVNARDSLGRTPLHISISSRNVEIAMLLISLDATDINLKDNDDITPLRLAIQTECPNLIKSLLEKSALTKDIMVEEWRKSYGKQASDIVRLSEREGCEKSVCFIAEEEFRDNSAQVSIEGGTDRRLFLISHNWIWQSGLIPGPKVALAPYILEISSTRRDGGQGDTISVAIQFPAQQDLKHQEFSKISDWDECRIAWTLAPPSNPNGDRCWKSLDYFSMMPFGWIPNDGLDFFKQFILYVKERWLKLCDLAKDHLNFRRLDQLNWEGKNPKLIGYLANDAQRWAKYHSSLLDQVRKARDFALEYGQRYNENQTPKDMLQVIGEFESRISGRINELDQIVRDLLQIEFAWVSMSETRISTRLGQNVMLLTYVNIFYLPLAFCAALWAIPNITESATRNSFIITATIVGLVTLVIAFNLDIIQGLYYDQKANLIADMRIDEDDSWKQLATELQGSSPNRRTPPDWWLIVYLIRRSIRRVVRKKGRKGDMESMPHGSES